MALQLKERGYREVYAMEGGFGQWESAGFILSPKPTAAESAGLGSP